MIEADPVEHSAQLPGEAHLARQLVNWVKCRQILS